ncbi:MAG: diaminopimelate dehydrogenase [Lachnospiraceae bacterium]|nr:diaminopimelate dehydrogenase [Lachnospiraceae bacterium]
MKIKIAICGYGNLGRGIESEIAKNDDMELVAIFTRRKPVSTLEIKSDVPVVHMDDLEKWQGKIDVMILCGGSAKDLPVQSPEIARLFNIVDSFDTHAKIPEHKSKVDTAARAGGKTAVISVGWDPGLFSIFRLYSGAIVPAGATGSFWGYGVSQGHSDAIRQVEGVANAVQYSIPQEEAIEKARQGKAEDLSTREKHKRLCYVVAEEGADLVRIENEIKEMPNYFADYDTDVIFATSEELKKNHSRLPHGGYVIHSGETGAGNKQKIELTLKLDSNPEFTASVMISCARAAARMNREGMIGAKTVFDIPPVYLSAIEDDEVVRLLL